MLRRSLPRPIHRWFCASHHPHKSYDEQNHHSLNFDFLFQTCSKSKSLTKCKQIHSQMVISGSMSDLYLTNSLLNFYSKCGHLKHAHQLFDQITQRNVVSWTSIITGYVQQGFFEPALQIFVKMVSAGEKPNQFTFSIAVRACTGLCFLDLGLQIHGLTINFGLDRDEFAGSALIDMYSKSGNLNYACEVFHRLFYRDSVSWNVLISGLVQNGDRDEALIFFAEMRVSGLNPNDFTFTSLLKCCRDLRGVEQIHGYILKCAMELDPVVSSALLDLYSKCGFIDSSRKILDAMAGKDGFAWSSAISGYTKNGNSKEALVLFREMGRQGMRPDQHSLSSALKACLETQGLETGFQIHTQMIKNGYQNDSFAASVLLNLYSDFDKMGDAEKVFKSISDRDIVSWNSMLAGYAQINSSMPVCFDLFCKFRRTGMIPDSFTFTAVLTSCQSISDLSLGQQIHAQVVKSRENSEICVENAVISMYAKCGAMDEARGAFDAMNCRDEISWSTIIGNYAHSQRGFEALDLCNQMRLVGFRPNQFCFASILATCSGFAAMDLGKQFHSFAIKSGFASEIHVGSSIVDMYGKCGNMEDSIKAFLELQNPNLVTFNALISGFAQNGKAHEAIQTFEHLKNVKLNPNKITFLALLTACSHVGLVDQSLFLLESMHRNYGITPESEHYSCLVDVLGRAGKLEQAYEIVVGMCTELDISPWRTLLSACRNHRNLAIAEKSAKRVFELEPNDHSGYVLLSNLYSEAGRWGEAWDLRGKMAGNGVRKEPGRSYVIVRERVHEFFVGDFSHPEIGMILSVVNRLGEQIKTEGLLPENSSAPAVLLPESCGFEILKIVIITVICSNVVFKGF